MRSTLILAVGLALAVSQTPASAQLLKKLEQRLGNVADRLNQPAEGEPTPAAAPGYLGLTADETDGQQGVVVLATKAGSPAETAGLKKGDLITAINGSAVNNLDDFGVVLDRIAAGQKANFTVLRGQEAQTISATLVARQAPPVDRTVQRPDAEDPGPPPGGDAALPRTELPVPADPAPAIVENGRASLGVSVVSLTDQARLSSGASRGAYVAAVRAGGPADRAGIPVGAVIVAIDGARVNTPDELVSYIAAARPGQDVELNFYRGGTLTRKTVRLAPTAVDGRAAPASNSPLGGIVGGNLADRPILRRAEQVLDQLARPAGGVPAGQMEDVANLRSQVELLQATVRSLEERLMKLEGKLGAAPGAIEGGGGEGGARLPPANAPVRRNDLELAPPDRPALPTPPATP